MVTIFLLLLSALHMYTYYCVHLGISDNTDIDKDGWMWCNISGQPHAVLCSSSEGKHADARAVLTVLYVSVSVPLV
jgi:hypothetical protein